MHLIKSTCSLRVWSLGQFIAVAEGRNLLRCLGFCFALKERCDVRGDSCLFAVHRARFLLPQLPLAERFFKGGPRFCRVRKLL